MRAVRTATARSIKSPTGSVVFSTADLRVLFDAAPFGVIAIDPVGRIQYVNSRQCENSGLRPEDFLGKGHRATFGTVLERAGLLAVYDRLIEDGILVKA